MLPSSRGSRVSPGRSRSAPVAGCPCHWCYTRGTPRSAGRASACLPSSTDTPRCGLRSISRSGRRRARRRRRAPRRVSGARPPRRLQTVRFSQSLSPLMQCLDSAGSGRRHRRRRGCAPRGRTSVAARLPSLRTRRRRCPLCALRFPLSSFSDIAATNAR